MKLFSRSSAAKALSLAAVSALVLSGCAAAPDEAPVAEAGSVDFLACAVSDEGNWNDKSFNEAVYTGLLRAQNEIGITIKALESATPDDFEPNLQEMVSSGCDLTIGVGFALGEAITKVALENPMMNFALVDSGTEGTTNVKPLFYATAESGFLAGYVAAEYSTSKIVSTYGGLPFPSVTDFMTGFYFGAMQWGTDNGETVEVLGWNPAAETGDFMGGFAPNSPESKAIALTQLNAGSDVVLPVGGDQFSAVATAIDEVNPEAVMIGVDVDIAAGNPDLAKYILTSIEKRMAISTFDIIKNLVDGGAFDVTPYLGTLDNAGTALSAFYDFDSKISQAVKDRLVELQAGIKDGSVNPKG